MATRLQLTSCSLMGRVAFVRPFVAGTKQMTRSNSFATWQQQPPVCNKVKLGYWNDWLHATQAGNDNVRSSVGGCSIGGNFSRGRFFTSTTSNNNHQNNDNWQVPKSIDIPVEKIDLSFTRSSGAGGQNVNKVSTKVELRFHVLEADWMPLEVRERLYQQQRSRINKNGYLLLACQEHRTQEKNRKTAVSKLEQIILEAYPRPAVRKMRKGVSKAAKERNKDFKRRRSQVKQTRQAVSSRDF